MYDIYAKSIFAASRTVYVPYHVENRPEKNRRKWTDRLPVIGRSTRKSRTGTL
ncbi:hypothetical protein [Minwuia sp.]|uniref:hypothetical protein n=1 Tax=Minwuia sp. TaxID=2493630 RepID=UPI003A90B85E